MSFWYIPFGGYSKVLEQNSWNMSSEGRQFDWGNIKLISSLLEADCGENILMASMSVEQIVQRGF